ncbi:MAG: metallophosphoesterase [Candidatus Eremiobacterota bacterium]
MKDRTLVAIGDLHGDYYKAERMLLEADLLLPGSLSWNPARSRVDLVFLGDYVDWRGEALEGPEAEWPLGARRVLELVHRLHRELDELRSNEDGFDSHLFALVGNHDDMMLEAHRALEVVAVEALEEVLAASQRRLGRCLREIHQLGFSPEQAASTVAFFQWYCQGGLETMEAFGGLRAWRQAMDSELGDFLRRELRLGVVLNRRLFVHSAPDQREFWRPLEEIAALPGARRSLTWSRRIWGYDSETGFPTDALTRDDVDEMLAGMGVDGLVVGHTPLSQDGRPVSAFENRVVNLDLHGFHNAPALVEEYRGEHP